MRALSIITHKATIAKILPKGSTWISIHGPHGRSMCAKRDARSGRNRKSNTAATVRRTVCNTCCAAILPRCRNRSVSTPTCAPIQTPIMPMYRVNTSIPRSPSVSCNSIPRPLRPQRSLHRKQRTVVVVHDSLRGHIEWHVAAEREARHQPG